MAVKPSARSPPRQIDLLYFPPSARCCAIRSTTQKFNPTIFAKGYRMKKVPTYVPDVPSATPEDLLRKFNMLFILFSAMFRSLAYDDPNLKDRMLWTLEHAEPSGMFSEDAFADALKFLRVPIDYSLKPR
jgi:hypothetical protein